MRIPSALGILALLPFVVLACSSGGGSSSSPGDGGGADAASPDGSPPPADGPFACGTSTCSATQFCVQQCTCGGVQACGPVSDAGTCPAGQVLQNSCCIVPCTNPPPSCEDVVTCGGYSTSRMVQCPCPG